MFQNRCSRGRGHPALLPLLLLLTLFLQTGRAGASPEMEWDGHLKLYTRVLFPASETALKGINSSPNIDANTQFRLNNKLFFSDRIYTHFSWEAIAAGGETRTNGQKLKQQYPALYPQGLLSPPDDDRRLLDLTAVPHDGEESFICHRLDRAMISFSPDWGEIRLGRQAVTWGHGFTFNPMDLVNPFSPADLERDYKMGDDMALVQFPVRSMDVESIFVVRRDPNTGQTDSGQNSFGTKIHFTAGDMEMEIMGVRHYRDYVAGLGSVGYLGNAAWRCDITATFLNESSRGQSVYASAAANIDYSWTWLGKNVYGYLELYYNGLSDNNYTDHFTDPAVSERISRGEMFALGSLYGSANINIEVHPLINLYLTPIVNLNDGSGVLLPRVVYDLSDNMRLTLSGAFNWGGHNTEYGGYDLPGTPYKQKPPDTISAWLAWYF